MTVLGFSTILSADPAVDSDWSWLVLPDPQGQVIVQISYANGGNKLIGVRHPLGPTLSATHIDSWETHSQDWTPRMREEFQKLRSARAPKTRFSTRSTGMKIPDEPQTMSASESSWNLPSRSVK